jgi:tRNA1(Val) A37 N6-methylase TrmN6
MEECHNLSCFQMLLSQPIAHADNPFGDSAVEDTTGYGIWCASLVMGRWIASNEMRERFAGKSILELGAGCGVPGLAAAHYR